MLIGAHVREADPVASAARARRRGRADVPGRPAGLEEAPAHPQAEELREGPLTVVVHAPYVVNLASPNNRIRIPSRKLVAQHAAGAAEVGAIGLVVHGGHVTAKDDPADGVENWRKFLARQADEGGFPVPVLIENTAGGDHAMARRFDALARLWDAVAEFDVGFCLDTCHAHAAGEELADAVDRIKAITGPDRPGAPQRLPRRVRLGRRPARERRRRHDRRRTCSSRVCAAAGAPVVVETPAEGQAADIAFLRERLGS